MPTQTTATALPFVASFARNPNLVMAWMGQPGEWVDFPVFAYKRATFNTGMVYGPAER